MELSVVIPTYQRRDAVLRLLDALAPQLSGIAAEVIVVVDGSTDGTAEGVETLDYPVPITVARQSNAGLAATRNRGLREASGAAVLFIDDDMLPTEGLVERHRRAHVDGRRAMLMGGCLPPADIDVQFMVREWAEEQYGALARVGRVEHPVHFSSANTSAPLTVWREVGGFDPRFVGWGGEDYEIAVRILRAGIPVAYDQDALAWHLQSRDVRGFLRTKRDEGRNTVRIVDIHPEQIVDLLPATAGMMRRLAVRLTRARPHRLERVASLLGAGATVEWRLTRGRGRRLLSAAADVNFLAGIAMQDTDGRCVARLLA